jgi:transcriptional regulator with XRE-family HTH domain
VKGGEVVEEKPKKYLAEWRLEKMLSQYALAKLSGVDRSIINRIEKDTKKIGTLGTAAKLAKALEVEPTQILDFAPLFVIKKETRPPVLRVATNGRI